MFNIAIFNIRIFNIVKTSGNLTCVDHGPVEIVNFPISNRDFPDT